MALNASNMARRVTAGRASCPVIRRVQLPCPRLRPCAPAAAATEMLRTKKDKKHGKHSSLYLLNWADPARSEGQGQMDVEQLRDQLKVLEKVSKDAVWLTVKKSPAGQAEGQQGSRHVLVVTNDAKRARKYGLQELKGDIEQVQLAGVDDPVTIPVAQIKESLMQQMEDSSDSSSDEDDMMTMAKMKQGSTQLPTGLVQEDPAAAQQAAELVAAAVQGSAAAMDKAGMQGRKLGDAIKEVMKGDAMMDDDSSSSSSSGSSDSDCEDMPETQMKQSDKDMRKAEKEREKDMKKQAKKEMKMDKMIGEDGSGYC